MAELKTKRTGNSVRQFLNTVADAKRRRDSLVVMEIMKEITGEEPRMWGTSIVGFGDYHYKYASGREGDWFLVGFSPRKQNLSIYIMGYLDPHVRILERLGKFKRGAGCLYINKLEDIDIKLLKELIASSVKKLRENKGKTPG